MKKNKVLKSLLLVIVLIVNILAVSCGKDEEEEKVVKILVGKESLCLIPVHIAIINGYFEEEFKEAGVKYEFIEAEVNQAAELIASGQINAAYGLTGSLMQPISNGLDISFTTGLHTGCTKYYVKSDSDIKTLADLKGKKIGIPSLSDSSVINLKRKLDDLGLDMTKQNMDVEFLAYYMVDLPEALKNGGVDAIGIHDPVATTAEEVYGFTKILDTGLDEKFVNEYCCQAYVSGDLIKNNPEGAAAYTRAMQKAAAYVQANPQEAAKLQIENGYMTGTAEKNGKILESLNYTPSVKLGRETFRKSFEQLQKIGEIDSSLNADDFVNKAYSELSNVPDSYTYDIDTKIFNKIEKSDCCM